LAGFAAGSGVGWLRDGWPVALFAAFGRRVRWLFLLLLRLLMLLMGLLVSTCVTSEGRGLIEDFVQGVIPDTGGRHRANFVLQRVAEA